MPENPEAPQSVSAQVIALLRKEGAWALAALIFLGLLTGHIPSPLREALATHVATTSRENQRIINVLQVMCVQSAPDSLKWRCLDPPPSDILREQVSATPN